MCVQPGAVVLCVALGGECALCPVFNGVCEQCVCVCVCVCVGEGGGSVYVSVCVSSV